jgi:hypothetical protein
MSGIFFVKPILNYSYEISIPDWVLDSSGQPAGQSVPLEGWLISQFYFLILRHSELRSRH